MSKMFINYKQVSNSLKTAEILSAYAKYFESHSEIQLYNFNSNFIDLLTKHGIFFSSIYSEIINPEKEKKNEINSNLENNSNINKPNENNITTTNSIINQIENNIIINSSESNIINSQENININRCKIETTVNTTEDNLLFGFNLAESEIETNNDTLKVSNINKSSEIIITEKSIKTTQPISKPKNTTQKLTETNNDKESNINKSYKIKTENLNQNHKKSSYERENLDYKRRKLDSNNTYSKLEYDMQYCHQLKLPVYLPKNYNFDEVPRNICQYEFFRYTKGGCNNPLCNYNHHVDNYDLRKRILRYCRFSKSKCPTKQCEMRHRY